MENKLNEATQNLVEVIENITGVDDVIQDTISNKENISVARTENAEVLIPQNFDNPIIISDIEGENVIKMSLPSDFVGDTTVQSDDGTILLKSDEITPVTLAVQPIEDVMRALIVIENTSAPKSYRFDIEVPEGHRLITTEAFLQVDGYIGEVLIVDSENNIINGIEPAWAEDANGKEVKTWYEIDGNTLVQHIEFDDNSAFPIVADPSIVRIAGCIGAIGKLVFGSLAIAAIAKKVAGAGGIVLVAKKLMGKKISKAALKKYGKKLTTAVGSITGFPNIRKYCLGRK